MLYPNCNRNHAITNFLLTESEVLTEKYWIEVYFVQTEPVGRGFVQKDQGPIFICKDQAERGY